MKRLTRDVLFNAGYLSQDLAQKSVRGGMTTISAQVIQFVLGTTSTVVLARLLTPEDFGLIAMVTVVVGFAAMFKDAGLSMATIQKDSISHEQISTLFWINIIISVFLGMCVLVASPLVAKFYGRPELTTVTAVLSISFIIRGLMIQHQALLRRHMKFATLAVIQITSQIITLVVTIVLALFGWRYWALVGGSISTALSETILTLFLCPWVPGRMKKGTGIRDMLKFGGHLTGFSFVNYFARNADNILIGRYIGADALGFYSKAYQILMLPIRMLSGPLGAVAIPTLSRLATDYKKLHRYYLHILYMLSLVASPIAAVFYISSKDVINIVLGPNWSPVADVFKLLAIGGIVQPLYSTQSWLHIVSGRADRVFIWGIIGTPIIVSSFLIGLIWGIKGVAFCYSLAILITTFASLGYAGSSVNLPLRKMVAVIFRPIIACVGSALIVERMMLYFDMQLSSWSFIFISWVIFAIIYACILVLFYRGFKPLFDLIAIKQILIAKPKKVI